MRPWTNETSTILLLRMNRNEFPFFPHLIATDLSSAIWLDSISTSPPQPTQTLDISVTPNYIGFSVVICLWNTDMYKTAPRMIVVRCNATQILWHVIQSVHQFSVNTRRDETWSRFFPFFRFEARRHHLHLEWIAFTKNKYVSALTKTCLSMSSFSSSSVHSVFGVIGLSTIWLY